MFNVFRFTFENVIFQLIHQFGDCCCIVIKIEKSSCDFVNCIVVKKYKIYLKLKIKIFSDSKIIILKSLQGDFKMQTIKRKVLF